MRISLGEVLRATGGVAAAGADTETVFSSVSTDTRTLGPGSLFVALKGPRFDGHDYLAAAAAGGASGAVLSRNTAPAGIVSIRVPDTLEALGALGRSVRHALRLRVVAITGSVGKTTTKEIVAAMLRAAGLRVLQTPGNLNNRVGLPLTLLAASGEEEAAVLELGISEPGEMAHLTAICEPDVAVVTAVALAHTEWLGDLAGVAREKLAIAGALRPGGRLVLPYQEPLLPPPAGVDTSTFGWTAGADIRGEGLELLGTAGSRFRVEGHEFSVPLAGRHQAENALAALAAVRALGVEWSAAASGLSSLRPSPLRGEVRLTRDGVHLLVDCYNANPRAAEAALETLRELAGQRRKVAVLGEMRELGHQSEEAHRRVGRTAARLGVERLYLLGEATRWIEEAATVEGLPASAIRRYESRETLLSGLSRDLREGDWVLIKGSRAMGLEAVAEALGNGQ